MKFDTSAFGQDTVELDMDDIAILMRGAQIEKGAMRVVLKQPPVTASATVADMVARNLGKYEGKALFGDEEQSKLDETAPNPVTAPETDAERRGRMAYEAYSDRFGYDKTPWMSNHFHARASWIAAVEAVAADVYAEKTPDDAWMNDPSGNKYFAMATENDNLRRLNIEATRQASVASVECDDLRFKLNTIRQVIAQ